MACIKAKRIFLCVCICLIVVFLDMPVNAQETYTFDMEQQLDALGQQELKEAVPDATSTWLDELGLSEIQSEKLLELAPRDFFAAILKIALEHLKQPLKMLSSLLGIILLCALMEGLKVAGWEKSLSVVFQTVSILCVITAISAPILDCILDTTKAIKDASVFMLSFIPTFTAALTVSGQAVTATTYNLFLFSTCQIVSQVVSQTLIPLMSIYLAMCIVGSLMPEINIKSAAATIKTMVSWVLGFIITVFVGLLSVQTMVSQSADSVTSKAAKFMIGSFVPVVGGALSEAFSAAKGCLQLLKTSVGAYGIIVALLIFLPVLLQTALWHLIAHAAAIASDIMGIGRVSEILKSCANVLGILVAVILCYALLILVSTTIVMVIGTGAA